MNGYVLICYDHDSSEETSLLFFKSLTSAFSKLQSFISIDNGDLLVDEIYGEYPYSYEVKHLCFEED